MAEIEMMGPNNEILGCLFGVMLKIKKSLWKAKLSHGMYHHQRETVGTKKSS